MHGSRHVSDFHFLGLADEPLSTCVDNLGQPDFEFSMELKIKSEANSMTEHWAKKAQRVKLQRSMAASAASKARLHGFVNASPRLIVLTRLAPRLLDTDNLQRAFKAVRDGVADGFRLKDDGAKSGVTWLVDQRKVLKQNLVIVSVWNN